MTIQSQTHAIIHPQLITTDNDKQAKLANAKWGGRSGGGDGRNLSEENQELTRVERAKKSGALKITLNVFLGWCKTWGMEKLRCARRFFREKLG